MTTYSRFFSSSHISFRFSSLLLTFFWEDLSISSEAGNCQCIRDRLLLGKQEQQHEEDLKKLKKCLRNKRDYQRRRDLQDEAEVNSPASPSPFVSSPSSFVHSPSPFVTSTSIFISSFPSTFRHSFHRLPSLTRFRPSSSKFPFECGGILDDDPNAEPFPSFSQPLCSTATVSLSTSWQK
jgi:hypothetical protein